MDDTKGIFLYVHAPWCVLCEKVGRVFQKLAKKTRSFFQLVCDFAIPFPVSKDDHTVFNDSNDRKEAAGVYIPNIEQVSEIDEAPSPEELVDGASGSYQAAHEELFEQSQLHDEL